MAASHATGRPPVPIAAHAQRTSTPRVTTAAVSVAMLLGACLWLLLLVGTGFSPMALSAGLLAMVYVMGISTEQQR